MFKEGDTIYHSKILSFFRKESFALEASYVHPDKIPYPTPLIGESHTSCFVCSVHVYSAVTVFSLEIYFQMVHARQ